MAHRLRPHRVYLIALPMLALVAVLGGCQPPWAAGHKGLVLYVNIAPDELDVWKTACKDFDEQSHVKVKVVPFTSPTDLRKLQGLAKNGAADVVAVDSFHLPQMVAAGAIRNLDDMMRGQDWVVPHDFFPFSWDGFRYQGSTYGVPYGVGALAMVYNADMLDAAYLKRPRADWTWDDFLKMAKELTSDASGDSGTGHYGTIVAPWWQIYVWQNGGDVADDPTNPTRSTLSTPEAQQALQWAADLHLKHHVAPSPTVVAEAAAVPLMNSGRVAMVYADRDQFRKITSGASGVVETAPLPRGKVAANLGTSIGFCIGQGSKQPELAWKLIAHLACGDGQKALADHGLATPAFIPMAKSSYFGGDAATSSKAFVDGARAAHPMLSTPRYADIQKVWDEELARLWTGQATVSDATRAIDERVNAILGEAKPVTAWLAPFTPRPSSG